MALQVINLFAESNSHPAYWVIAKQAIRSASSTAAHYRAMCLGRSRAERFAKLCIVVEEADETSFWLDMAFEAGLFCRDRIQPVLAESLELSKIFTAYRAKYRQGSE